MQQFNEFFFKYLRLTVFCAVLSVVNALAPQRQCIVNILRACIGLPPDDFMVLEHKVLHCLLMTHDS